MGARNCSIPKLFRQDFPLNDKSSEPMVKMTNRRIRLGIDWVLKKGETVDEVANNFKVSTRRIEQLVKIFKETGEYPVLNPNRRPKVHLTDEHKEIIKQAYNESYFGAKMLRHHIIKRRLSEKCLTFTISR